MPVAAATPAAVLSHSLKRDWRLEDARGSTSAKS